MIEKMDLFATINNICRREDGRYLISLTVGDGERSEKIEFVILGELFCEIEPSLEGNALDEDAVALLDKYADITAAFSSACSSLAFTPCSAKALLRKLRTKGFSKDASEAAIELCIERGYIDESSLALRRAEIMVAKLWGRLRIFSKLREEGFDDSAIQEAAVYLDEIDFADSCMRVIEKKYAPVPDERREKEKMYAALVRLGYSSSDIKEAIERLKNDL